MEPGRYRVVIFTGPETSGGGYPDHEVEPLTHTIVRLTGDLTLATGFSPTPDEPDQRTRTCREVGFEPESDHGAFDIRATGVPCDRARDVARAVQGEIGETYRYAGFTCRPQGPIGQLPTYRYECTNGSGARIRFEAS